jgi:hypothetical protein
VIPVTKVCNPGYKETVRIHTDKRAFRELKGSQLGTVRTMFHMSWSGAESISLEGWERVLHRPAQRSLSECGP